MKTCPLRLELHCAEGPLLIEPFRVDRFHADELDPLLAEHFWEQGKPLPYLKELQSLRQFKADYFIALVAGRTVRNVNYPHQFSLIIIIMHSFRRNRYIIALI